MQRVDLYQAGAARQVCEKDLHELPIDPKMMGRSRRKTKPNESLEDDSDILQQTLSEMNTTKREQHATSHLSQGHRGLAPAAFLKLGAVNVQPSLLHSVGRG